MQYRVTVTTIVDDDASRFSGAEQVKDELARWAIFNRVAFADKMRVSVERVDDKQPQDERTDAPGD